MAAVYQPAFSTVSAFPETVLFEIAPDVLDHLRDSILEGFTASGNGGFEVLGVLWGVRGPHRSRVQEFRSVKADLSQPRFLPTELFARISRLIEDTERDPTFNQLQVLGWFRSSSEEAELPSSDVALHKAVSDFAFPFLPGCLLKFRPVQLTHIRGLLAQSDRDGKVNVEAAHPFLLSALKPGALPIPQLLPPANLKPPAKAPPEEAWLKGSPVPTDTVFRVPEKTPKLRFMHWAFIGLALIMAVMALRLSHSHKQSQALAIRNSDLVAQVGRVDTRNRRLEALVKTMRGQCESAGKSVGNKP